MKILLNKNSQSQICSIVVDVGMVSRLEPLDDLQLSPEQVDFYCRDSIGNYCENSITSFYLGHGILSVGHHIPRTITSAISKQCKFGYTAEALEDLFEPIWMSIDVNLYRLSKVNGVVTSLSYAFPGTIECVSLHYNHSTRRPLVRYRYRDNSQLSFIKRVDKLQNDNRTFYITNMTLRELYKF